MSTGLFIFECDLRLVDNNGLNGLSSICSDVYGAYVLECPTYKLAMGNAHLKSFINEQLMSIKNIVIVEKYSDVKKLAEKLGVDHVYMNKGYREIEGLNTLNTKLIHDGYLQPLGSVVNVSGEAYKKFTPFYMKARKRHVEKPNMTEVKLKKCSVKSKSLGKPHSHRLDALKILASLKNYNVSTGLSQYINQGCISVREAYHALENAAYRRELYWRDFYANVAMRWPQVFDGPFYAKYAKLKWVADKALFNKWCIGQTGVKQVDAAMRMLIQTGRMPNRLRLIVANYLVKGLFINWQWGEAHFAKYLIDFDQANNNGNWQWVASTGADAQPYFRTFNPYKIVHMDVIEKYCTKSEILRDESEDEIAHKEEVKKIINWYSKV